MEIPKKTESRGVLSVLLLICFLAVIFLPAYAAASTAETVYIPVKQVFASLSETEGEGVFAYEMRALESGNPLPAGAGLDTYRFTLTGNTEQMLEITYTSVGEYRYEVRQIVENFADGYTYDPQIYTVLVQIKNRSDGGLGSAVYIGLWDGGKTGEILFENGYQTNATDPDQMPEAPIRVRVEGSPSQAAVFSFVLKADDAGYPMPAESMNGEKRVNITGSGEGVFGTWRYTSPGTYQYTVYQEDTGESGYTYDKTVYTITDVVTNGNDLDGPVAQHSDAGANGRLILKRTITDSSGAAVSVCAFVNTYVQGGAAAPGDDTTGPGGGTSAPKTGDEAAPALWMGLMAAAIISMGMAGVVIFKRRKEREDK